MAKHSVSLGTESISKLLIQQAVPASIGILVMSLNMIVDTIFVGRWLGPLAISAITVVIPVTFFIGAIGLAVGIGGTSVLSRALGADDHDKALKVFGNQITLTLLSSGLLACIGLIFQHQLIEFFGADESFKELALTYYRIVLYGIVMLAMCMMGNNVIRAEGKPKFAMYAMMLPAIGNIFMDWILIKVFDMGMEGAAWATFISYAVCFAFIFWFFMVKSELRLTLQSFFLNRNLVKEINALSFVTLARQGTIAVLTVLLNNVLITHGDALDVASYGIISRMLMFALFPVIGVNQGFLPIAGYNYGARKFDRVRESINTSIKYSGALALLIFIIIMAFPSEIVSIFISNSDGMDAATLANNAEILERTPTALRWVFAATPVIVIQLIGASYFQAIGRATPALLLSLTKQGFFLIPLLFILPPMIGILGVWIAFPIADVLSTLLTGYYLNKAVRSELVS
ncbi:MAG TPA: MATE family efflux transporter [Flavobacteriaceae bacterium]|nr:MATE family efflux transporter [Flavobacteriaceae bacterium]MCB9212047.1 MATE family efflux transporter [Alteromonas sp.]HPF09858.1 MATE family efflux transporter [Flavobacteriaceae bacterium]HQU19955.1 MATE family efflux transporter [Flavobacteriaceae bacterium]HQU64059.1 MATE family efflux transporter [Flavobacteriaceae bacterium]